MSNIRFSAFEEESKAANSGGLVSAKHLGSSVILELTAQWEKDGKTRTKSGALGVTTTDGWMNASELITYLGKLDENDEVRQALIEPIEVTPATKVGNKNVPAVVEYELVVGSAQAIEVHFNKDGKLTKVELR